MKLLQVSRPFTVKVYVGEVYGHLTFFGKTMVFNLYAASIGPRNTDFYLVDLLNWMICFRLLLLVSSFRKMFAGVLSEKEIVGSKNVILFFCIHEPFSQTATSLC